MVFANCNFNHFCSLLYNWTFFLRLKLEFKKKAFSYMIGEIGDFEIAISLIVLSLLVWFASYKYSMRVMKKKEF